MALILIAGLDRTGKSTVAEYYVSQGYELIHMLAPDKKYSQPGYAGPSYLDDYVDLLTSFSNKNVVFDRFWDGELVYPQVYGRPPMLSEDDIEILREIEDSIGVKRILMHDTNVESHWQRCVDNKEPLTKAQFARAKSIYYSMANKYNFELITLPQFIQQFGLDASILNTKPVIAATSDKAIITMESPTIPVPLETQTQLLERANVINDVLKSRVLKKKGKLYDELDADIKSYLKSKLSRIFGKTNEENLLTQEEIAFYKAMYKKATEKGDRR